MPTTGLKEVGLTDRLVVRPAVEQRATGLRLDLHSAVPVFEHIAEDGGDFRAFYAEVKRLALLREERDVLSQFRG